nr:hypothetical protein [Tanacetum cinerariifolium]
ETLQLAQESRLKMKQLNKEIKPENYTKINHLSGVFVSQTAKSREELHFSNTSKKANVSKPISIPNEEFSDDTTPSVARRFLNEGLPKIDEIHAFSKPVTSYSVPASQESKVVKNDNVIDLGMFRIYLFKPSREEKYVPNKVRASVRTNSITISQPHVITKKDVNSNSNGLSSTGVHSTAKTRRPQPRSNTKNDRNKKHMSSECNNIKLAIRTDKSEVIYAMCKQCLITPNHDVCVLNYANGMNSHDKKQKENVSNTKNLKKQKPKVMKPKKVGSNKRLASPKLSKRRSCLRWSPTGRFLDLKGKIFASSESESQSNCSNGDNAYTSNPLKPTIKRFLNSTLFLGTVRFGNDHVAVILSFGDIQWGNILITRVYFVEGLGHNLFSVRQFCDSDLEIAFKRKTCFVRKLEGVDLLKGNRSINLYTINLYKMASASPIFLMARATSTKSWLWQQQATRTMLIFSCASLFLWAEAIATACYTRNRSIIHRRFNKTPYELINDKKPNISFLYIFGALCYPKNDCKDIRKLGAKGDIGFFIGYSADFCAYRFYNRRIKKIIEIMNVTFDELSAMDFEQNSSKPELQSMTSGQINSGLDITYASSTITTQQPTKGELGLLFESMYHDYIGGQPSAAPRITSAAQAPQDVDKLKTQQQHLQHQPTTIANNVPNAMFDENAFVNPFATLSTSDAESSSSQYVDLSNKHTFYQPCPHEHQCTKNHLLEQVIGESSRPVLTRNQLRSDGDMFMYALTVSTIEPKNVKEAMTDPAWIESMQE